MLRSFIERRRQEGALPGRPLAKIRAPRELDRAAGARATRDCRRAWRCSAAPCRRSARSGPQPRFEMEIEDPVLGRKLAHAYHVQSLPLIVVLTRSHGFPAGRLLHRRRRLNVRSALSGGAAKPWSKARYDGITVLDFTQGIAGPHASMLLALHGADVIKIEPPEGDWGRALGELKGDHCAHSVAFNRGKRSIALDLKSPDGIAVVKKIAAKAARRDGELPARRDPAAGLRLRGHQEGQSQGRLLLGLGLRPDRPLQQAADRRRADPGLQRHDGDEQDAGRHAVAAGHDRRRRHDRPLHLPGAGDRRSCASSASARAASSIPA